MENEIKVEGELLKEIMPQKIPMLFCTKLKIENFDAKEIEGFYEVGEVDCAALDEKGNMPILALVEVMAQTVAARIAYQIYLKDSNILMGLFLSVRNFKVMKRYPLGLIPKGTKLKTCAQMFDVNTKLLQADFETYEEASNELIAKAKITMFAPNKDDIKELFGEELLGQLKS
ncbi:MAG: hypothetical protein UHG91_09705 [Succinivibrionaceae bacterium]|nr:hypothetical protein [Ruminobacter sp.]MEE1341025.1 hypothetical protein [Succinivibrionaceae bacterium]